MQGYFAVATEGRAKRPGILIVHDAFGLDSHCIGVADRLARKGFAALAIDLWGDRRQFTNPEDVKGTIADLLGDRETWMGRVEAARRSLVTQTSVDGTRIAAIGYCLGGSTVLEFARFGSDVMGVVSFHGGLDFVGADWDGAHVKAKLGPRQGWFPAARTCPAVRRLLRSAQIFVRYTRSVAVLKWTTLCSP